MHPYIKHLLQDIKKAERSENDNLSQSYPSTFAQEIEEVEGYISGEGEHSISYFIGLKKEHFPPGEQLSEKDISLVLKAFNEMLKTWNAIIDFPEKMPLKKHYEFLRNTVLEENFTPVSFGFIHFDFCSGYAPDCAWGKYCNCLEFDDDQLNEN